MNKKLLSTTQCARRLGISRRLILRYIHQERLEAQRYGDQWLVDPEALNKFASAPRRVGRPRKLRRDDI